MGYRYDRRVVGNVYHNTTAQLHMYTSTPDSHHILKNTVSKVMTSKVPLVCKVSYITLFVFVTTTFINETNKKSNALMPDNKDNKDYLRRLYDIGEHAQALASALVSAREPIVVVPALVEVPRPA